MPALRVISTEERKMKENGVSFPTLRNDGRWTAFFGSQSLSDKDSGAHDADKADMAGRDDGTRGDHHSPCTVIMPTWNSARTLARSIERIREHLPGAEVITVDKSSTDGTLEIATRYGCRILEDNRSLGSARMVGIRAATTEWIAFIDDDIMINEDFSRLFDFADEGTGAVQGHAILIDHTVPDLPGVWDITKADRGYTNVTILRRELLLDLDISTMNAYEDWTISRHIIDKGYWWRVAPIMADHDHDQKHGFYRSAWNTCGLFRMAAEGHLPLDELVVHYFGRIIGEWKTLLSGEGPKWDRAVSFIGCIAWPIYQILHMKR
jgi:glycosyltransferase involved in cell wall biosynthesis